MPTATIIGSGPNGLAAAIVLASAGINTKVLERNSRIGGACSTAETTLPGFQQDLGSSAYPMGFASPFFRSLPVSIPWIIPPGQCAHPLDDGTAVVLEQSIGETVATLDSCDLPGKMPHRTQNFFNQLIQLSSQMSKIKAAQWLPLNTGFVTQSHEKAGRAA